MAQFISYPLAVQTIPAGPWLIGVGEDADGVFGSTFVQRVFNGSVAAIYLVNGATGLVRTTIFSLQEVGIVNYPFHAEITCWGTVNGVEATVVEDDYLVIEVGNAISSSGSWTTPTADLYTSHLQCR
jgi:hypothetical protein